MGTISRAPINTVQPRLRPVETEPPRLGIIALATDLTFERDAARLIGPDEAAVHVTRIRFANPTTPTNLNAMGPEISAASALLVPGAELSGIAFACTAASVTISNDVVEQAIAHARPDVPVVTPSSAALDALRALSAKRIALLTPYLSETTAPMIDYFDRKGVSVVRSACFGLSDDRDMARLDRAAIIEAAVDLDSPDLDAVFLSCTAMPSLDAIDAIEERIGKPVIGSNQVTLWALRRLAGLPQKPPSTSRFGRLFDISPESPR